MSYWVLKANVMVVSIITVSRVTNLRAQTDDNKVSFAAFDKAIEERHNNEDHAIVEGGKFKPKDWIEHPINCDPDF